MERYLVNVNSTSQTAHTKRVIASEKKTLLLDRVGPSLSPYTSVPFGLTACPLDMYECVNELFVDMIMECCDFDLLV